MSPPLIGSTDVVYHAVHKRQGHVSSTICVTSWTWSRRSEWTRHHKLRVVAFTTLRTPKHHGARDAVLNRSNMMCHWMESGWIVLSMREISVVIDRTSAADGRSRPFVVAATVQASIQPTDASHGELCVATSLWNQKPS